MRYLIILEDGQLYKQKNITDEDKESADGGVIDIVDTKNITQYYEDKWYPIQEYEE